uniref:RING-type E3 ubiquitin transferase n=1 Tax=Vitis vinifera TaxID=29760 RepID=F6GX56_VITVI
MVRQESKQSPEKQSESVENDGSAECVFSPRFKSVAALAGWDEEALLIASLVVEDTPDRLVKHKKRSDLTFKTPPSNSRRKRRTQRRSPASIPVTVLDLDEGENAKEESEKKKIETKTAEHEEKNVTGDKQQGAESSAASCSASTSTSVLPCMDRLREELSCAICLEICFEPSTTPCGHSFCKKCLRSAADKCGKRCSKCRQMMSNGRSCTVNTVLWNTIQLLFPQEVEARKAAGALNSREAKRQSPEKEGQTITRNRSVRPSSGVASRDASVRRRRGMPSQSEDAALALRLQREEFMEAFREQPHEEQRNTVSVARANLRAMASRAVSLRVRGRPYLL